MVSGELAGEWLQTGFERRGLPPRGAPLDTVYPIGEHLNNVQRMVSGGYSEGLFPDTVCWTRLRNTWLLNQSSLLRLLHICPTYKQRVNVTRFLGEEVLCKTWSLALRRMVIEVSGCAQVSGGHANNDEWWCVSTRFGTPLSRPPPPKSSKTIKIEIFSLLLHLGAKCSKSQIASDFKSLSPNRKNISQIAVKNASNRNSNHVICNLKAFFKSQKNRNAEPFKSLVICHLRFESQIAIAPNRVIWST